MKQMKKIAALLLALAFLFAFAGCKESEKQEGSGNKPASEQSTAKGVGKQFEMPEKGEEIAVVHTSMGDIYLRLFPEAAPKAVENFTTHAKNGYYNNVTFHRVMNDFMIQGGDPEGTGMGGESIWGTPFEDEFKEGYCNYRGALSMANAGSNTNGSQFFIVQAKTVSDDLVAQMEAVKGDWFTDDVIRNYKDNGGTPWLDGKHTVFGQVFKGMNVVDAIAAVTVDENSKPLEEVRIESVEITAYEG